MLHRSVAIGWLVLRGGAIFLAIFLLIGLIGEYRGRVSDLSLWLVDLRDISVVRIPLLGGVALLLFGWGIRPGARRGWSLAAAAGCGVLALAAARDVVRFYADDIGPQVQPQMPIPLSLVIAIVLAGTTLAIVRGSPPSIPFRPSRTALGLGVSVLAWAFVFPLAQMLFFGTTDYRRPADAAVVFGARVYANGEPSVLLADRIATGVDLYREGLVPILIMSGGDGADGYNEARVMRDVAVADGVDPSDVIVDATGVSTEATVANTFAILVERGGSLGPGPADRGQPGVPSATDPARLREHGHRCPDRARRRPGGDPRDATPGLARGAGVLVVLPTRLPGLRCSAHHAVC